MESDWLTPDEVKNAPKPSSSELCHCPKPNDCRKEAKYNIKKERLI